MLMTYTTIVGSLSWSHSMWCLTWMEILCFFLFIGEIIVFLYAYDFLDEIFDYETHSIFFFVGSLVPMVLFMYSLSARSGLDLDHLYTNFLIYYEKKFKERPVREEASNEPEKVEIIPIEIPRVEEEVKKEELKELPNEDNNELNEINMSLVISKASVESGEKSHVGEIPQMFPGTSIHEIEESIPSIPAETRYKQEFQEILAMTIGFAKTSETLKCILWLVIVAGAYSIYNVEYSKNSERYVYLHIGVTQTLYLIYLDIVIILWSKSKLRKSSASITESSLLMLLSRIALSFSLRYWVICQCAIYVVLSSIISTS